MPFNEAEVVLSKPITRVLPTNGQVLQFESATDAWKADSLTASDISGLAAIATSGSASDLTTGTVPNARLDADLAALANNSTNGLWARTGSGTGAARTLTGTAGQISVADGDGVAGNPTISLPSTITQATTFSAGLTASTFTSQGSISPSNATLTWTAGAGSPEGAVTAVVGSLYSRTNGGGGTCLYVKESGTGNTGWVAVSLNALSSATLPA